MTRWAIWRSLLPPMLGGVLLFTLAITFRCCLATSIAMMNGPTTFCGSPWASGAR